MDAIGLIGQLLDHIYRGSAPKSSEKQTRWDYQAAGGGGQMLSDIPIRELIERQARRRLAD